MNDFKAQTQTVDVVVKSSGMPGRVIDLQSQVELLIERGLQNPYGFALVGSPKSKDGITAQWTSFLSFLMDAFQYPGAHPNNAVVLARDGVEILMRELDKIPLDATGHHAADSIAKHLGEIHMVNGLLDLSTFPVVDGHTIPDDPADANLHPDCPGEPLPAGLWHKQEIPMRGRSWMEGNGPGDEPDGGRTYIKTGPGRAYSVKGRVE
jgi:hypothetical protein